jgi:hypothetical protein
MFESFVEGFALFCHNFRIALAFQPFLTVSGTQGLSPRGTEANLIDPLNLPSQNLGRVIKSVKTVPVSCTRGGGEPFSILMPFPTAARANSCGGKVRCAVPRGLFQKTGLKVWFFN